MEPTTVSMKHHWESIFSTKTPDQMSWTQPAAVRSLDFIKMSGIPVEASIVDVGSGTSILIRQLIDLGYVNLTVLDISSAALATAKENLGEHGAKINWLVCDVLDAKFETSSFDLWHDRAVFHFLILKEQRTAYIDKLKTTLKPRGHAILSTFSLSGPEKCSGLEVCRYSPETLLGELGPDFTLVKSTSESHDTPSGKSQNFVYCLFRKNS